MQADTGLHFVNTIDNQQAIAATEQLNRAFKQLQQQATTAGSSIDTVISHIAAATGITIGAATLKNLAAQVMNIRGEFQQLEIAFATMLGSADKANKLMQQLTHTAATTPFDLKGVAQGAKQLLAYGIAAEDVNQTLINLGDIAAGLSIPLGDMVMLYGTTMVQGRMFTQDLRQFMGRGIPLVQALADTMGVAKEEVQDLVSAGKVGSQEFQTALMSLVAEGGQFGGLMEQQSKSISGQISNIEDGIDMMFNEIGQKAEPAITLALSGVSNLVENYQTVGKAVLALAGTYGTYRAALVVVAAVEKAHNNMLHAAVLQKQLAAQANIALANSDAMAAARKAMFTTYIKANTKAVLKNTAAMLTNPAVLITAGLVALCATIYGVTRALDTQARAQERVNQTNQEQKQQLEQTKNDADAAISTIKSETATVYEKAKAYQTLQKIMPELTNQYSQTELATLNLTSAQKAEAKALEGLEFDQKRTEIENSKKRIADYQKQIEALQQSMAYNPNGSAGIGLQIGVLSNKIEQETKYMEAYRKELSEMEKLRAKAQFDAQPAEIKIAKFTADKEAAEQQLAELQQQAATAAAKAKAEWEQNPLNQWKISVGMTFEQAAGEDQSLLGGQYLMLQSLIKGLQADIQETDKKIQQLSSNASKETLQQLIADIQTYETEVVSARKQYAADMSQANKQALDNVEETLKAATEKYKSATGTIWVDSQKLRDDQLSAMRKAENEKQRIFNSSIQAERVQREAEYWQTIKEINQEEAAYRKAHNGRTSKEFAAMRDNATLQFDIDTRELDRQFEDWKKAFEQETLQISIDAQTDQLEGATSAVQSIAEKIQKQNELYEHQIQLIREKNKAEADQTIRDTYGADTLAGYKAFSANANNQNILSSYSAAKSPTDKQKIAGNAGLSESLLATYAEMEQVYDMYSQRLAATIEQQTQQHNADMLNQDLNRFTSYLEQTLSAEEQYQQRLADIRSQYGLTEDTDLSQYETNTAIGRDVAAATVERERQQAIITRDTGIGGDDTRWVEELAQVGADVAGKAMEEVRAVYDQFIAEVQQQIDDTIATRDTAQANITAEKDLQTSTAAQVQDINTQLAGDSLSPEQEQALLEQRATLEQQIAESKERQAVAESAMTGSQQQLNQLTQVRAKAETVAANATDSASTKSQKKMQATERTTSSLAEAFAAVKESADAIADTFGGVLSQKAKKALGTMSDVASFGEQTINSIASLTQGTMKGMSMSAFMASESISTVEKASVILTIISMAVQAVMAIVKIASQFTKSAQMQDAIDEQTEKVDNLKKRHEELERSYKDKSGTEYYKGLAKSAKDYDNIIAAQTKAVQQAKELYQRQKEKYGEDSDKAKEAKEQLDDLEDNNNDLIDSQREQYNQLLEGLSGTNLQSFSESLADALIDGFAQGREGIDDVWEDTMDDLMRTMMRQQLALAIQDMFKDTFYKLNNMTKYGDLTQSEIDSIMSEFDAQSEKAKYLAEKYYDLMSERGLLDDADAEGSQGFGQMTQDTADALNARFTALQIEGANVVEAAQSLVTAVSELGADSKLNVANLQTLMYNSGIALQVAQEQLDQLQVIADNTALLADTNDRLKAIQQNTSRL